MLKQPSGPTERLIATTTNPVWTGSLHLATARTESNSLLAVEVEKRLHAIGCSRESIKRDKMHALARELSGLSETIAGPLATDNLHAALVQMRLLLSLGRVDGIPDMRF